MELGVSGDLGPPDAQHELETLEVDPTGETMVPADVGDVDADQSGVDLTGKFLGGYSVYLARLIDFY